MLWLALSSTFASEHQLVLSVEFLPIQRYARGRWLEGKIHRKPGVRSPGKASVEEPKMSPCVRKQSQSLDLKMICEETCGRHNEGSLKCYTYLCTTFLLNFICPQGSVAQIHSKAHWFQKVEKCLLSQGNCFSSSGYSDKFIGQSVMFQPVESAQEGEGSWTWVLSWLTHLLSVLSPESFSAHLKVSSFSYIK